MSGFKVASVVTQTVVKDTFNMSIVVVHFQALCEKIAHCPYNASSLCLIRAK